MKSNPIAAVGKRLLRERRHFPPAEFYAPDMCSRCGVCCGSTDGSPCEHLRLEDSGKRFCEIYENRFGPHRTTDGRSFVCVPIQRLIESNGGYACCEYVKAIKRLREAMGQDSSDLGRLEMP